MFHVFDVSRGFNVRLINSGTQAVYHVKHAESLVVFCFLVVVLCSWVLGGFMSMTYLIHYKVWNEITYPFLNSNGATVEV